MTRPAATGSSESSLAATNRAPSKIPTFDSIEDEAEFWDTHDSAGFEDEFAPVEVEFARPLAHALVVPLDAELIHRIGVAARARGVGLSALTRTWIEEGLARIERDDAVAPPVQPTD